MITKQQQLQLKQPVNKHAEPHYTIGGTTETAVHQQVERRRSKAYAHGQQVMNKAVEDFRNNMAFKAREGQAKSQFQQLSTQAPKAMPLDTRVQAFRDAVKTNHKTNER